MPLRTDIVHNTFQVPKSLVQGQLDITGREIEPVNPKKSDRLRAV